MPNTKILLDDAYNRGSRRTLLGHETTASEDLTPGELVEFGGSNDVQAHSSAGQDSNKLFCLEDQFKGNIDTDITQGNDANVLRAQPGDKVYAWLDSSSADVSKGDRLESAGNGNLQDHTNQSVDEGGSATYDIHPEEVVAFAAEDVTSGTSRKRIKVEVV